MGRKLLIRDVTLRDGQQSLFATRMNLSQIERVLPLYKQAGFYAMEVWGGAVPDSVMRFLNEDPWERLEKIKAEIGNVSHLTALSRGRNLFGYNPYPESVIEGFNRNAVQSGISIMRIFDALNDANNIKTSISYVQQNGGLADCVICYTVDPKFSRKDRIRARFRGERLPKNIFTLDYFINLAKKLESMGADMITLKDMAGLVTAEKAGEIIRGLKQNIKVPIDFHTHCTPGYGLASMLMAIVNGVDIVDTAILNFSGGPAAPGYELIQIICDKMGIETGVDRKVVAEINRELKKIRVELDAFDSYKQFPIEFDISKDKLPAKIDKLFDKAISLAEKGDTLALLPVCLEIEKYFNYPEPDEKVLFAEVPGGMYTNLLSQLKQLKQEHLLPRVLEIIPTVRLAAGCPPLVTPTSQIVGAQAVNCIIDENSGKPFYTNNSIQFVNLVKGSYGKTPIPVKPEFRKQITGSKTEVPYNTAKYKKQDNPKFPKYGDNVRLANNEKEELLLELFPSVANKFLNDKILRVYDAPIKAKEKARKAKFEAEQEQYLALTFEEKNQRLMEGIYNNW